MFPTSYYSTPVEIEMFIIPAPQLSPLNPGGHEQLKNGAVARLVHVPPFKHVDGFAVQKSMETIDSCRQILLRVLQQNFCQLLQFQA